MLRLLRRAEIADAVALFPVAANATIPLVGSGPVCALYAQALSIVLVVVAFALLLFVRATLKRATAEADAP